MSSRSTEQAWRYWRDQVLSLVGVEEKLFLSGTLPRPWFLLPQGEEIDEERAFDLFHTVRRRLLLTDAFNTSAENVRGRLRRMRPEDSLPLLYAMRYVARQHGSAGRYWPSFREEILESRLTLPEVQQKLAPALGEVWRKLHAHTRRSLYFPEAGREIIKWPLAHAGLLRGDEKLLGAFGSFFVATYGKDDSLLAPEGLDAFLVVLRQWFVEQNDAAGRLAWLVGASDGTEKTIGELVQRWIKDNRDAIVEGRLPAGVLARSHRSSIRYDVGSNRVFLVLNSGTWPGDVAVWAIWDGRQIPVPSRFSVAKGQTEHGEHPLPLLEPGWSLDLSLQAGEERRRVSVRNAPGDEALVFRGHDGRSTDRWVPDDEHYVIVPAARLGEESLDRVFEEWFVLGSPEGWEGHRVLFCRPKDPLARNPSDGAPHDAGTIAELERAASELGLPSFRPLWRPRARLVGGSAVETDAEVAFSAEDPPCLEVRGAWEGTLPVSLSVWDENRGRFVTVDQAGIRMPHGGEGRMLDLWLERAPAPGLYRLELDSLKQADFRIVPPQSSTPPDRLDARLEVRTSDGSVLTEAPTPHDLEHGTLVLRAWPRAHLTLDLTTGTLRRRLAIETDDAGEWRVRWRHLGFRVRGEGKATLTVAWRGLVKHRVEVSDAPFVSEGDFEVWTVGSGQRSVVRCRVSNAGALSGAKITLLGSRPWSGHIWSEEVQLSEDGAFQADLPTGDSPVNWAVVSPEDSLSGSSARPWLVRTLSQASPASGRIAVGELRSPHNERWAALVPALERAPLPPALRGLLNLYALEEALVACPNWSSSHSRWIALEEPADLAAATDWAGEGPGPDLIVLADDPPGFAGSGTGVPPPYLVLTLGKRPEDAQDSVALSDIRAAGLPRKLKSYLDTSAGGENPFVVVVGEPLYGCPKCSAVLTTPNDFDRHRPIGSPGSPPCITKRPRVRKEYAVGRRLPVRLYARSDPEQIVNGIKRLIWDLAAGRDPVVPQRAERWLEELEAAFEEVPQGEATDWLIQLPMLTRKVRNVGSRGRGDATDLIKLGEQVRKHRSGLLVLWRWLRSELG